MAATYATTTDVLQQTEPKHRLFRWFWCKWALVMLGVFASFILTLPISPIMHMDEFIIVDLGRYILNPNTDWSINWLAEQQHPVFLFSYLGVVIQELAFIYGGEYAPRVVGLIGAIVAATVLVGWLSARHTVPNVAFLLGIVFLLDPLFVQAFSLGRLDGWAMASSLGCCWVLRSTHKRIAERQAFIIHLIVAGALACLSFFLWPSAVFLFPLISLELFYLVREKNLVNNDTFWKKSWPVLLFMIGGILAILILLLPIASRALLEFSNILQSLKTNTQAGPEFDDSIWWGFRGLITHLKFTPVLVVFALIAIVRYNQVGLTMMLFIAITIMLATIVYVHRVTYLVPYFFASISVIYQYRTQLSLPRSLKYGGLAALLIWSISLSLVVRPYLALNSNSSEDRKLVHKAAESFIGPGKNKVLLLSALEFYYPGRTLGWKMYSIYMAIGEPLKSESLKQVLGQVDYVVLQRHLLTKEIKHALNAEGMYYYGSYTLYNNQLEKFDGKYTNVWRLRFLYKIFEQWYGPYVLYVREKEL